MMTATPKTSMWTILTIPFLVILMTTIVSAAPPGSPNNDDLLGSSVPRVFYRSRETIPNTDDNAIPMTLESGQAPMPVVYEPHLLIQQPSDNAILNFLLTRRLGMGGNRARSYVDTSSNEISRKRSYSKFCAFNAVSCFGK